jgi:malate/lactate dehydrogenase
MKLNPMVTELSCFDVAPVTPGVAADLDHMSSNAKCVVSAPPPPPHLPIFCT